MVGLAFQFYWGLAARFQWGLAQNRWLDRSAWSGLWFPEPQFRWLEWQIGFGIPPQ
jgi:hypothetical protein